MHLLHRYIQEYRKCPILIRIRKTPTYQIPPITSDLYRCFVIPNVTSIDKFISGMEVLPGNRNIVHHVLVFQDQGNTVINLDNADTLPGYTSFEA